MEALLAQTPLAGKVAIITGAAGGIGAATSRLFAARGAQVALADVNRAAAQAVAAEIGTAALPVELDLAQEHSIRSMIATVLDRFGRIDVLNNNAADLSPGLGSRDQDIETMAVDVWDRTFHVNVRGSMLCCKGVFTETCQK